MFAEAYRPAKARQRRAILITTLLAAACLLALSAGRLLPLAGTAAFPQSRVPGRPALAFEPTAGRADPAARFVAHTKGGPLFFPPAGVVLALTQAADPGAGKPDWAATPRKPAPPGG